MGADPGLLDWIANTGVARMVQESTWGYPIVLSAHAVGMAILAGIVLVIHFRVLGLAPGISFSGLKTMYRISWLGLVINAISGGMLFAADPAHFFFSTPFRIKMILLVIGLVLLIATARRIFSTDPLMRGDVAAISIRIMAATSIVAWVGVIVAGRLIAYWGG